jgi:hypothetical protein
MLRLLLGVEAMAFLLAALIHSGALIPRFEHRAARIAETVLAVVLLAGLALIALRPVATRSVGLAAQGFALLGTLVGILTIVAGVGPQSLPDLVYHGVMVLLLGWGLLVAVRGRAV